MSSTPENYFLFQRYNQLLGSQNASNEQLLAQLRNLKRSQFLNDCIKEKIDQHPEYARGLASLEEIQNYVDRIMDEEIDNQGVLGRTQNALFREFISLQIESQQIEENIANEEKMLKQMKRKLQKLRQDPQIIFNQDIKKEKSLLFQESQFEKIKEQISEIEIKIESINMMDGNIGVKIEAVKQKTQQLKKSKIQLTQRLSKMRELVPQKQQLIEEQRKYKEEKQKKIAQEKLEQEKALAQRLIKMLKNRKVLESQIEIQQKEKQSFIQLLMTFKGKYDEVEHKNHLLKAQLKQKGIDLTLKEMH